MKQACRQRLNIVKVISHKSWHLSKKSKKAIYYALVRSLMEYASFIFATLSQEYKNAINSIQYDALRIIYKRDRLFGNKELLDLAGETTLDVRLNNLNEKYLCRALITENPLIDTCVQEYLRYKSWRVLKYRTALCSSNIIYDETFTKSNDG